MNITVNGTEGCDHHFSHKMGSYRFVSEQWFEMLKQKLDRFITSKQDARQILIISIDPFIIYI